MNIAETDENSDRSDAVFNEAAIVSIPRSLEKTVSVNEVYVSGTLNLLQACLDSGVKCFIEASPASTYGNTDDCAR